MACTRIDEQLGADLHREASRQFAVLGRTGKACSNCIRAGRQHGRLGITHLRRLPRTLRRDAGYQAASRSMWVGGAIDHRIEKRRHRTSNGLRAHKGANGCGTDGLAIAGQGARNIPSLSPNDR